MTAEELSAGSAVTQSETADVQSMTLLHDTAAFQLAASGARRDRGRVSRPRLDRPSRISTVVGGRDVQVTAA